MLNSILISLIVSILIAFRSKSKKTSNVAWIISFFFAILFLFGIQKISKIPKTASEGSKMVASLVAEAKQAWQEGSLDLKIKSLLDQAQANDIQMVSLALHNLQEVLKLTSSSTQTEKVKSQLLSIVCHLRQLMIQQGDNLPLCTPAASAAGEIGEVCTNVLVIPEGMKFFTLQSVLSLSSLLVHRNKKWEDIRPAGCDKDYWKAVAVPPIPGCL